MSAKGAGVDAANSIWGPWRLMPAASLAGVNSPNTSLCCSSRNGGCEDGGPVGELMA